MRNRRVQCLCLRATVTTVLYCAWPKQAIPRLNSCCSSQFGGAGSVLIANMATTRYSKPSVPDVQARGRNTLCAVRGESAPKQARPPAASKVRAKPKAREEEKMAAAVKNHTLHAPPNVHTRASVPQQPPRCIRASPPCMQSCTHHPLPGHAIQKPGLPH